MRCFLLGIFLVAALAAGCKKDAPPQTPTAGSSAPASSETATAPVRGPGTSVEPGTGAVVPAGTDTDATLHQLSVELRRYVVRTRSVPRNFDEFAAKSHVQFPPAPAGKK